jgi:uncharacterized protein (DUF1778 family)
MAERKSERILVRVTPSDKRLVERAAAAAVLDVAAYVRQVVVTESKRRLGIDAGHKGR